MATLSAMLGNPQANDILSIKYGSVRFGLTVAKATVVAVTSPEDLTFDLKATSGISVLAKLIDVNIPKGTIRVRLAKSGSDITAYDHGGSKLGSVSLTKNSATTLKGNYDQNSNYGFKAKRAGNSTTVETWGIPHNPTLHIV
jgi:hypothetical protein